MSNLLKFENISKSYGKKLALSDVSFQIDEGSVFGILGANGSGKSTLMKILAGLIKSWTGNIFLNSTNIDSSSLQIKNKFGYLIEAPKFYEYLSARKNLEILASLSNIDNSRIDYVFELLKLTGREGDNVSSYSYGMKQRLGLAQAILHNPDILILDEPNNGLDPNGINDMSNLIQKLNAEGKTICISTHILNDVENMCTNFTVFKDGKNSKSYNMKEIVHNSNLWTVKTKSLINARIEIDTNNNLEFIKSTSTSLTFRTKNKQTFNEINSLFINEEIYEIKKELNLIDYIN